MYWQDDDKKDVITTSDKVVDVSYKLDCRQIPTSHAWELQQALYDALPWIMDEPEVGVHQIHGATSGNGWERPPDGELLHLSKRTRMNLRVPTHRIGDASELVGKTLEVDGHEVCIGKMSTRQINPLSTIFSRYIVVPEGYSEDQFLQWIFDELQARHISARKLLPGISHDIYVDGKTIATRSLMIADLDKITSIALQEVGLGPHRHLGCGIFIPHKGIKAVGEQEDKTHFSG